ncbi:MAG TPA: DUF4192 domain-containing protein [Jiangellaceae bacterium]
MRSVDSSATVVTLSGPSDLVGVLPALIGFRPSESLVVLCMHGSRLRTGLAMRFDLPPEERRGAVVAEAVRCAVGEGADAVLVVCYTDGADTQQELPQTTLVQAVVEAALVQGVGVVDALLVRGKAWFSYTCEAECCPRSGTPLPDPGEGAAGRFAAEAALHGRVIRASRAELEASVRGPVAVREIAVRQVFDRAAATLAAEWEHHGPGAAHAQTVSLVEAAVARRGGGGRVVTDDQAARIVTGLDDRWARDDVATLPVEDQAAFLDVLVELARRTPDGRSAAICTVVAWVAYQHGNGALANVALDRALRDDPAYVMARVLLEAMGARVHPSRMRSMARDVQRRVRAERPMARWA